MSRSDFIKYINSLEESELREELKMIYGRFKEVKKFYTMELGNQDARQKVYKKAFKEISGLYLIRGHHRKRPRIQKLNKLFSDLKKNSVFPHELIDIYLHSVQHGLHFIRDTKRSPDPVSNHLLKSFDEALRLIHDAFLYDQYSEKLDQIIQLSSTLYFKHRELLEIKEKYN